MLDLSFGNLRQYLLNPDLQDHEIVSLVKKLQSTFISRNRKMELYGLDADEITAYSILYFPTNFPKFSFLMDNLSLELRRDIKKSVFIDIGTGPGTYLLSFLDYFGVDAVNKIIGLDKSNLMLKQARRFLLNMFPGFNKFSLVNYRSQIKKSEFSGQVSLFFGNSLNEIGEHTFFEYVSYFNPEILFFIEPGTKDFFKMLSPIRERLVQLGFSAVYPCNSEGRCPMDKKNDEKSDWDWDWCHQILYTTHSPSIERLCQLAKMDRRSLPMAAHLYCRNREKKIGNRGFYVGTLVRKNCVTKFGLIWKICTTNDGEAHIVNVEVLKKKLDKSLFKRLKNANVGISFNFEIIKKIREDYWSIIFKGIRDI